MLIISWAELYLNKNHTIIYYAMNLTKTIEVAQQNGSREIYLTWWSLDIGWKTNIKVPEDLDGKQPRKNQYMDMRYPKGSIKPCRLIF